MMMIDDDDDVGGGDEDGRTNLGRVEPNESAGEEGGVVDVVVVVFDWGQVRMPPHCFWKKL
jgi:hypothetical protein